MKTVFSCVFFAIAIFRVAWGINVSSNPRRVHEIEKNDAPSGITSLGDEVFITWKDVELVHVYDVSTYTLQRTIPVPGMTAPYDIAASERNNCLYIVDSNEGKIFRVDLQNGSSTSWQIGDNPYTLSVAADNNIIVTFRSAGIMKEFTADGQLVRELDLGNITPRPTHIVKLPSGELLVSHSGETQHRICRLDEAGNVKQCFGNQKGYGDDQLMYEPQYFVVDQQGQILVADEWNERVLLLSPSLTFVKKFIPKSNFPGRMHLDKKRGLLYVGQWGGVGYSRAVVVYSVA